MQACRHGIACLESGLAGMCCDSTADELVMRTACSMAFLHGVVAWTMMSMSKLLSTQLQPLHLHLCPVPHVAACEQEQSGAGLEQGLLK